MNYHISTGLILQEFNDKSECPVCQIQKIVESQLVDQFLNEAVMVDNYRNHVNKKGFCRRHTVDLFSKQNKLGLALQHSTRLKTLLSQINITNSVKEAKKQAEFFLTSASTCIICEIAGGNMERYYKTVAEMFYNEPDFKDMLLSTKGFCMTHYGELLQNAKYAKGAAGEYITDLTRLQNENVSRIIDELNWFCDKHDYRNADSEWKNSKDALPRSIIKLHGES